MSVNSQKDTLKLFWRVSNKYKWRRGLSLAIAVANFAVGMFVIPLIIASFLDLVQSGQLDESRVWGLITVYALAQLWSEVIGWRVVIYLMWTFQVSMQRDLYAEIFDKLSNQTMFFHSNKFGGSLVSQTNKLTGAIERFWDTIIWSLFPVVISVIGSTIVLWFIYWPYALFMAILSITFVIAVYFGSKHMARLNEEEAKASNKISGHLSDVVANILTVKTSSAEKRELKNFMKSAENWRGKSLNLMRNFLGASTIYSSLSAAVRIGALIFAIYATKQDVISVASIYLIITYTSTVAHNLWNVNGIMRTYNRVMGDSREMVEILSLETSIADSSQKKLKVESGSIEIKNIKYTHDEGEGDTLFENFSLTINPGEKVGLVGGSGSGKTTLTKLILRLSGIDEGAIVIDGQNIANHTQASLRDAIAYVPQEPLLFHRSVLENISYSKPNANKENVEAAARKAGAHDFIVKLKDGYETLVGERGVKLSGGQRQRIAIARALLKDAPILILDEATSALDSESEKLIQKSLSTLMQGRTSIVIAHRLSTIAKLDRIIVLDDGKIAEDGTHNKLIAQNGVYAKLWKHQSGGFIEE